MRKKLMSLVLIGSMLFSFTACGQKQDTTSGKGDEPYTVTMVLNGTQQKEEERIEKKINEILEPQLNAKLDLVVLPWASAAQQLQLMLSGDEKIDCFYTTPTNAAKYMNSGQIIDMTALVDQYGTNLKNIFGEEVLKTNTIKDFMYGVPTQIERGGIPAIFMRKDIVEKYHIDTSEIKEPKDLEQVFETVKVGEPDMTMLFSINTGDTPINRMFSGDNLADSNFLGVLMNQEEDTKIENFYATDWYMENTKMLYDWYQKGYISKDAGTSSENWRTVCKAGNLFSVLFSYHPGTPVEFESSTGYQFDIVKFADYPVKNSQAYSNVIFSIAQNCENPEKTMEVLDYIYGNEDIMNLLNWGEEGVDYIFEDKENGVINYPEGVTIDNVGYSLNLGWELPNQFIAYKWSGSDPRIWEKMQKFNDSAKESKALGFLFDDSNVQSEIAALSNVVAQYSGSLNSGSVDPEVYIPKFLKELEAAGIDKVISEKQKQFDEWLSNK